MPSLAMATRSAGGKLSIRPEDVRLVSPGSGMFAGTVSFVRETGLNDAVVVDVGGTTVVAITTPRERTPFKAGDPVDVTLPLESCVVVKG